jgi:hypothetical protein
MIIPFLLLLTFIERNREKLEKVVYRINPAEDIEQDIVRVFKVLPSLSNEVRKKFLRRQS